MTGVRAASSRVGFPGRVVAIGGGTGLPGVLRGLRARIETGEVASLTGIVAMTDDGGSSGRLRRTRGLPPPGDVRNCLVALAAEEDLLAGLFQHRYEGPEDVGGHSLGNLILAALAERTGSFLRAVEVSSRVLRTVGRILPATLDDVTLEARLEDGSSVLGECRIDGCGGRVAEVRLRPAGARPTPGVLEAIAGADLVVLGPGSLYTSLIPNLVVPGIGDALRSAKGMRVLVANLAGEQHEAAESDLAEHVRVVESHAGGAIVDAVLVHDGPVSEEVLARYRDEGATLVRWPGDRIGAASVVRRDLWDHGSKLRHDPHKTAGALIEIWRRAASGEERAGAGGTQQVPRSRTGT